MNRGRVAGLVAAATLIAAVAVLPLVAAGGCTPVVNDYTTGQSPIKIAVGEMFDINLKADQGAGYLWDQSPWDTRVLRQMSSDYLPPGKAKQIPGMGDSGAQTWRFKGLRPGSVTLHFEYVSPPSGGQVTVRETQEFNVVVQ